MVARSITAELNNASMTGAIAVVSKIGIETAMLLRGPQQFCEALSDPRIKAPNHWRLGVPHGLHEQFPPDVPSPVETRRTMEHASAPTSSTMSASSSGAAPS